MAKRAARQKRRRRRRVPGPPPQSPSRAEIPLGFRGVAHPYAPAGPFGHDHGPRCGCGGRMVPVVQTLADELGEFAPFIEQIIARNPPVDGMTERRGSLLTWTDATGEYHSIDLVSGIFFSEGEDDDDEGADDDDEQDTEADACDPCLPAAKAARG